LTASTSAAAIAAAFRTTATASPSTTAVPAPATAGTKRTAAERWSRTGGCAGPALSAAAAESTASTASPTGAAAAPSAASCRGCLALLPGGIDDQGFAFDSRTAHLCQRGAAADFILGHDDRKTPEFAGGLVDGQRDVIDIDIPREQQLKRIDRDGRREISNEDLEHARLDS
jgi:hypothetical protein